MDDTDRKLVTVRRIEEVRPIPNADAIEAVRVDGWWVVAKKGEFSQYELVLYFEIDSWVPTAVAPFLTKEGRFPKVYKGVEGERLRTVKLRGQLSQGLVLPISLIPQEIVEREGLVFDLWAAQLHMDVTEYLGVLKWEREMPAALRGLARGNFPSFIPKTDQQRIQNIGYVLEDQKALYEVTTKLDGSSITMYVKDGEVGVCSRNLNLKLGEENQGNAFVGTAMSYGIPGALESLHLETGRNLAFQGELMGPGIQGNRENLKGLEIFIFDIYDIDAQAYLGAVDRGYWMNAINDYLSGAALTHVPVVHHGASLDNLNLRTIDEVLAYADSKPSLKHKVAEGLVFKEVNGMFSWKAISNRFLLKEE